MSNRARRDSIRIVLELDLAGNGPSGRLVDDRGSVSAFFGWLQLMDGLEGARERAAAEHVDRFTRGGEAPPKTEQRPVD